MLLALDTATATASLAVYDLAADQLLAEFTWQAHRQQTRDLLVTAQAVLAQVQVVPQQLTALAVTTGPGSFTGVRIALAAAKGLGLGLPSPPRVIGLPTLCVTAAPWLALAAAIRPVPQICAYMQAGRGRYTWAFFVATRPLYRPGATEHTGGTASEFAQSLAERAQDQPLWLVGEVDAPLEIALSGLTQITHIDAISINAISINAVSSWRRAGHLAKVAALHLAAGTQDDLKTLQPIYLHTP